MKYFLNNTERKSIGGTNFIEFQKGKYNEKLWKENSLYITQDNFDKYITEQFIKNIIPKFDIFDTTEIDKKDWKQLYYTAIQRTDIIKDIFDELKLWVDETFLTEPCFTICGM